MSGMAAIGLTGQLGSIVPFPDAHQGCKRILVHIEIPIPGRRTIMSTLNDNALDQLQSQLRGQLLRPADAAYEGARSIWNAMIDRHPAAIARCAGTADVICAVNAAREQGWPLAVRGGGHNIAGNALCDDGLVIDLSLMRWAQVDPESRRARVAGGCTLADFDHEAQAFGLATPLGINSTTGVAGLTLGGGFGWLSRKYGLTVDNLVAADIVTAKGKRLRTSAERDADLFWAIRGGGGNFGVVTEFEFALHPVGPEVFAGLIVFPFDQAREVLARYRDSIASLSDEVSIWAVMRQAPPLPFLPAEMHGKEIVAIALFCTGGMEQGQAAAELVRGYGQACGEHVGPVPYAQWQQTFDPLLTPGARNYWKSHNFTALSDGAIDLIMQYIATLPSSQCEIFLGLIGGQASRQAVGATAYPHRDVLWALNVHTRWSSPEEDNQCMRWARDFYAASAPHAAGSVYVNFLNQDETERIGQAYGGNFERLLQVKRQYDPDNLFHHNQNIREAEPVV
jgi:FAD/FMN-containing dehydrogenase